MKIKFDPQQQYQLDAIQAVIDIFNGQPLATSGFEMTSTVGSLGLQQTEFGLGNRLVLSDEAVLRNVQTIQQRNAVTPVPALQGYNFSVEMETGTGKTYVFLRTILELNKHYGFTKFVIVPPSVAIREGIKTSIELTRDHFKTLYDNTPVNAWVYDSKYASRLREYASNNQIQILIMNIDAFNKKDIAIIHSDRDQTSGRKPIEFIQACNPIVIIDEPQNMETNTAKEAIASLNPLCTLRYSATHRNPYNLMYRLGPVKAYDLGLVKRIEVDSVLEDPNFNKPYIQVKSIKNTSKSKIVATLEIDVEGKSGPSRKTIKVDRQGLDLFDLSGGRQSYKGYIVQEINSGYGFISFSNGISLNEGQTHGGQGDDRMKIQIRETVKEHFEKELQISKLPAGQRIKVLSLFFIDRVANYRTETGEQGKIAAWFIEAYKELASNPRYKDLNSPDVEKVHDGYFAQDKKKGILKESTGRENQDDRDAFELIMKDKTRLLSMEEPLKFVFSHSALREGWDNPNVFQICTLNETRSEMKKRQEIGRGLRLPVRENGERCFDHTINRLTVVANESYEDFARDLQREIEEETGEKFEGRIKNKKERRKVTLKKGWRLDPDFKELWDRIKHRTRYAVRYGTEELANLAAAEFSKGDPIQEPKFQVRKSEIITTKEGLETQLRSAREEHIRNDAEKIPDIIGYLQSKTELTRGTLAQILIRSGRLGEIQKNPQAFLEQALEAIQRTLRQLMVDGIKYEKIDNEEYEMMLFEEQEIESYIDRLLEVKNSIFDCIEFDSETERKFAEALDSRDDIKLFFKLPGWFLVKTPLGNYNPDWAIVKETDKKLYLVRETKGSVDKDDLRTSEQMKIDCGKAHFDELEVDFKVVKSAEAV